MGYIDIEEKINDFVEEGKIMEAIEYTEAQMKIFPTTAFNAIIGKDLLHLTDELVLFLRKFEENVSEMYKNEQISFIKKMFLSDEEKHKTLKTLYCEVSEFTDSFDSWFITFYHSHLLDEEEFPMPDASNECEFNNVFQITGFEELQSVYREYDDNEEMHNPENDNIFTHCSLLVLLRIYQLFDNVYNDEKYRLSNWNKIKTFVYEFAYYFPFVPKRNKTELSF